MTYPKVGDRAIVSQDMFIYVENKESISSSLKNFRYGDSGSISHGGFTQVLEVDLVNRKVLVEYTTPDGMEPDAYQCPSGTQFYLSIDFFVRMNAQYFKKQEEIASFKSVLERRYSTTV